MKLHLWRMAICGAVLALAAGCVPVTLTPGGQVATPASGATTVPAPTGTIAVTGAETLTPTAAITATSTMTPTETVTPTEIITATATPAVAATTAPTTTEATAAPEGQMVTVTLADDGKTIRLPDGTRFLLKLGESYNWNVTIGDQSVVSRVMGITVVRGAQGVFEARQAGETMLAASGDPLCRQNKPACTTPSRGFQVHIIVQ